MGLAARKAAVPVALFSIAVFSIFAPGCAGGGKFRHPEPKAEPLSRTISVFDGERYRSMTLRPRQGVAVDTAAFRELALVTEASVRLELPPPLLEGIASAVVQHGLDEGGMGVAAVSMLYRVTTGANEALARERDEKGQACDPLSAQDALAVMASAIVLEPDMDWAPEGKEERKPSVYLKVVGGRIENWFGVPGKPERYESGNVLRYRFRAGASMWDAERRQRGGDLDSAEMHMRDAEYYRLAATVFELAKPELMIVPGLAWRIKALGEKELAASPKMGSLGSK